VTIDEIAKNRRELKILYAQLHAKNQVIETRDDSIAKLEAQIDHKFNLIEGLERDLEEKEVLIKDLERELAGLMNKKVEPSRPKF